MDQNGPRRARFEQCARSARWLCPKIAAVRGSPIYRSEYYKNEHLLPNTPIRHKAMAGPLSNMASAFGTGWKPGNNANRSRSPVNRRTLLLDHDLRSAGASARHPVAPCLDYQRPSRRYRRNKITMLNPFRGSRYQVVKRARYRHFSLHNQLSTWNFHAVSIS